MEYFKSMLQNTQCPTQCHITGKLKTSYQTRLYKEDMIHN